MFINGYNAQRGGDISIIFRPGWKGGSEQGATHGLWYPFDSHLPLVWMGWNVPHGYTNRRVEMTDIAPTIAAMLKIQMPSGRSEERRVGKECRSRRVTELENRKSKENITRSNT